MANEPTTTTLKSNYAVKSKYEAFYTGGKIQISADGVYMFCGCGNKVNVLEISTGKVFVSIGQDEDEVITSFQVTPDDKFLVTATQHLLLRQWNWKEKQLIRTWKAIHFAPVVAMTYDVTSTLLATGSADSTIKLWDMEKQYCTHNLRGHEGLISTVAFHPDISKLQLFSAGEDYKVRVWDLKTSKCIGEVATHYSLVTSIAFSMDNSLVFTSSRDGIVAMWDAANFQVKRTIPVFEVVESLVMVPETGDYSAIGVKDKSPHFITAGNKGVLRVWNASTSKCVFSTEEVHASQELVTGDKSAADKDTQNIIQMMYCKVLDAVSVVTFDHNISILGVEKLALQKQFAGNNDEIVDVKVFGEENSYALVATNSQFIKVFELSTWNCEILYGHTDIVLSLDVVKKSDMFISSGKDNTVRLWKINPAKKQLSCLAIGQGHTHAVGAVAFSRLKPKFFVSGSEDCTLKLWNVPSDLDPSVTRDIHAAVTERAHDKNICSVAVAPNDKFVATGSMDKTAKVWDAKTLKLLGVMRGHKRGIWCVDFSPVDQVLATSSGDGTIKIWLLTDYSCAKTFEGHDCAVLKVSFISRGMQLLSSGTNGLIKLWTIKTNECVKTLDEHTDKVWALNADIGGETFLTGAADSNLVIWENVTEKEIEESRQKQEEFILQEQELSNLIQQKKYLKAIGLAITLEQPFRVLTIIKEILGDAKESAKLVETMEKLRMDQIDALLRFACQWNTNSRHCLEAQTVIKTVLELYPASKLKELGNLKSSVEALIPYTDRHFSRMSRLLQQAMFLEYTWQCMKSVATDESLPHRQVLGSDTATTTLSSAKFDNEDATSSESEEDQDVPKKVQGSNTAKTTFSRAKVDTGEVTSSESEEEQDVPEKSAVEHFDAREASDDEDSESESDEPENAAESLDPSFSESEEDSDDATKDRITSNGKHKGNIAKSTVEAKAITNFRDNAVGSGSDTSDDSESDVDNVITSDRRVQQKMKTPRVSLYKEFVALKGKKPEGSSSSTPGLQKRKMTDHHSVVKKNVTTEDDVYFIDKTSNEAKRPKQAESSDEKTGKKGTKKKTLLSSQKLKKNKTIGNR